MNEINQAAIYCRLSKDDEQSGDSVSIETQKMMLTKYCSEQGFEIFDIYIDDGYSGLNFNRPSFQRLIRDLETGKFDIVVTKDLSRLGRDYIQTGYYIDVYFITKHIRYIAVNDGIDTQHDNNDIAPFKNILNDMYAKDLSRKVKTAKLQRAQNGLYISAQPPYGYKVDPHNRNQLIIDSEVAQTVKYIFELAASGCSYSEIGRILENRKIISPSAYKTMHGDTRFIKCSESQGQLYKWPYQTVKSILTNRVYVGDMVNHKVETVNYKTKERVRVPVKDQIIVCDKHEPIIDRETFEAINKRLSNRRKANHRYENIFKGIIFCSECGEELQLITRRLKYESKPMFRCPRHVADHQICMHNHFIYYDALLDEVQKQIAAQISRVVNSKQYDELCETILKIVYAKAIEIRKNRIQQELSSINKRIKVGYRRGAVDDGEQELDSLFSIQRNLINEITGMTNAPIKSSDTDLDDIKRNLPNPLFAGKIDEKSIKLFVNRIEIGHLEKRATDTYQTIKIHYLF